jgi:hypothetical protein
MSSLAGAIGSYHGGLVAFREIMKERRGERTARDELTDVLTEYVDQGAA